MRLRRWDWIRVVWVRVHRELRGGARRGLGRLGGGDGVCDACVVGTMASGCFENSLPCIHLFQLLIYHDARNESIQGRNDDLHSFSSVGRELERED